jgi:hypothetical protein
VKKREIEDAIWSSNDLTPTERLVALAICRHHNDKTGACFPSQERIAMLTGFKERAVRKAVASMRAKGIIETVQRRTLQIRFMCSLRVSRHEVPGTPAYGAGLERQASEFFGTLDDQEKAWWAKAHPHSEKD